MHPALSEARFNNDIAGVTDELCEQRAWKLFERHYPILDVGFSSPGGVRLRVRFVCDNWNEQPPSAVLHEWDGSLLVTMPPSSTGIFNASAHPVTGRPFICMRGLREWHTHSSHVHDLWEPLRSQAEYRLGAIVHQVWSAWIKSNH